MISRIFAHFLAEYFLEGGSVITNRYDKKYDQISLITFLAAAAAAILAAPEPPFFWGLNFGGLGEGTRFLDALEAEAEFEGFFLDDEEVVAAGTSASLSLLSLKIPLYRSPNLPDFSTVLGLLGLAVPKKIEIGSRDWSQINFHSGPKICFQTSITNFYDFKKQ